MHIKFINRGTGSAKSAEDYTLQEHDHKGEIRESVEVLRGNPSQVTAVADSLDFKHKYTSGVIAWHKDDQPTAEQINEVLDDFERVAFAGLDGDQYCYYAVWHGESNGAGHIHIIAPRVELATGKAMNIAPPNWQKTYDVIRDKHNIKNGWARPEEISHRKLVNTKINIHSDLGHTKAKAEINKAIMELVERGTIANAEQVESYLNSVPGITVQPRRGDKSLSVKVDGIKKNIKLQGLAYERRFSSQQVSRELEAEQEQRARASQEDRSREYGRVSEVLEDIVRARSEFNRGRYDKASVNPKREDERSSSRDNQGRERDSKDHTGEQSRDRGGERKPIAEPEQDQAKALASSDNRGRVSDTRANDRYLHPRELDNKPVPRPTNTQSRDGRSEEAQGSSREVRTDSKDLRRRDRIEDEARRMASQERELVRNIRAKERALNDRVRERVEANLESTRRAVQERAINGNTAVRKELAGYQDQLRSDHSRSADHHREAKPNIERVREGKQEHKDTLRRSAGAELDRASEELEKPIKQAGERVSKLGDSVRDIGKWFGEIREKAIVKIKEITRKVQQQTQSWGMSR